jgi:hypothetical protein
MTSPRLSNVRSHDSVSPNFDDFPSAVQTGASGVDFDPFSTEATGVSSTADFSGVVDFGPILKDYVKPIEELGAEENEKRPTVAPFPKFETTAAAVRLAEFVKAEFGITATFGGGKAVMGEPPRRGTQDEPAGLMRV